MPKYTCEVKMFATIKVEAESEAAAIATVNDCLGDADVNFGSWPNGDPILGTISADGDIDVEIESEDA